jgi:hypothetical protein
MAAFKVRDVMNQGAASHPNSCMQRARSERPAEASAPSAREQANLRWGTVSKTPAAQQLPYSAATKPLPRARLSIAKESASGEGRGFPQEHRDEDKPRGRAGPNTYTDRGTLFRKQEGADETTFTYDAIGSLTAVRSTTLPAIDYHIDAQERRVGKSKNGSLDKQYLWSSDLRIVAEFDGQGALTSRFIYGQEVNVPALVVRPSPEGDVIYRVITDQLGSPVLVVNIDDASDVLLSASYSAWGEIEESTSSTGTWPIPFGFAGGALRRRQGVGALWSAGL